MSAVGGSFPSGHMVSVLVCLGGALLVVQQRPRWWEWVLVGLVDLAMGLSLLLQAAHWLTDVVGAPFWASSSSPSPAGGRFETHPVVSLCWWALARRPW